MPASSQAQSHLRNPLTAILGQQRECARAACAGRGPRTSVHHPDRKNDRPYSAGGAPGPGRTGAAGAGGHPRVRADAAPRAEHPHPFASALLALFEQERQRWDALLGSIREVLAKPGTAVAAAWLYGSVARGEDSPGSDIDIAVLVRSQAVADRLREELMALEDEQHLRVSLTALTPKELATLPENDPWWSDVVRDARVLKGPAPAQAKRRSAGAA